MKLPFKAVVQATGKIAEMNKLLEGLALKLIDAGGWPNKVIIGEDWLSQIDLKPKSFWFGEWQIEAAVEVVPGDRLEVLEESIPVPL